MKVNEKRRSCSIFIIKKILVVGKTNALHKQHLIAVIASALKYFAYFNAQEIDCALSYLVIFCCSKRHQA